MIYPKGGMFKLMQLENGLVLVPANTEVKNTDAKPLVVAEMAVVLTYMHTYLFERIENQRPFIAAHNLALRSLGIMRSTGITAPPHALKP